MCVCACVCVGEWPLQLQACLDSSGAGMWKSQPEGERRCFRTALNLTRGVWALPKIQPECQTFKWSHWTHTFSAHTPFNTHSSYTCAKLDCWEMMKHCDVTVSCHDFQRKDAVTLREKEYTLGYLNECFFGMLTSFSWPVCVCVCVCVCVFATCSALCVFCAATWPDLIQLKLNGPVIP